MNTFADYLWGNKAKTRYLFIAAALLLLTFLGGREIWTQEHRWADIVAGMFYRHDFLHPYLNEVNYYDKPLLSYWLIAAISFITGELTTWALRLPSALAGLLAIYSIYRIGYRLRDKNFGLLASWLLLTTFYFLFWARTSSADMLNMAGSLFAVCWYIEKRDQSSFLNYAIFFGIIAVTCLCKGLVGAIVPLLVIFPDLLIGGKWKQHLSLSFFLAMIPAAFIYALPFWASSHFGVETYQENGLYLVYRENILRYFQPFDHKGPLYTYFIFLPVYLLPWAVFFIPAIFSLKQRWKTLSANSRWMVWAVLILFLFFTLSGSRRNYYILPVVPFAILMTADWIREKGPQFYRWTGKMAAICFVILLCGYDIGQALYYAEGGNERFATDLRSQLTQIKPWSEWQFVMLDPESKTRFYLQLPPTVKNYTITSEDRTQQNEKTLLEMCPALKKQDKNVIFITRKMYEPLLKNILTQYRIVEATPGLGERILHRRDMNVPVAFIPS